MIETGGEVAVLPESSVAVTEMVRVPARCVTASASVQAPFDCVSG